MSFAGDSYRRVRSRWWRFYHRHNAWIDITLEICGFSFLAVIAAALGMAAFRLPSSLGIPVLLAAIALTGLCVRLVFLYFENARRTLERAKENLQYDIRRAMLADAAVCLATELELCLTWSGISDERKQRAIRAARWMSRHQNHDFRQMSPEEVSEAYWEWTQNKVIPADAAEAVDNS
jgi:hypothetical protein